MALLELSPLIRLTGEFRLSMRQLIQQLGIELDRDYRALADELGIPSGYLRHMARALPDEAFSQWKVVGWIEAVNDLVYFLDIWQQWRSESDRREFAEQLFAECQEKFFENSYLDDLFPTGKAQVGGLDKRLVRLCARLGREILQESLWLDPATAVEWVRVQKRVRWAVSGSLAQNFEKAEEAATVPLGLTGDVCKAPPKIQRALKQAAGRATFLVDSVGIMLKVGREQSPIWSVHVKTGQWHWPVCPTAVALCTTHGAVTVGSTLEYGKDRQPRRVVPTDAKHVERIQRAWETIHAAWPDGHEVLALLTSRLIPLDAKGVVSFSYRHRPALSFINCFERDNLDLIDDLIHENSHHHLNLLLRKHVMYRGDHNQKIFYSPWRRSLRPLRGILHATFTFTMGAMLFERLSSWAAGRKGAGRWKQVGLTARDLARARFRCLEEVESVRYSLQDLHYADHHLGWLTGSGRRLVGQLTDAIEQVERSIAPHRKAVLASTFGPAFRKHMRELQQARQVFGPVRLGEV
ncbi:MAG: HEXXH motif-containing putative peptide modification protein [Nitrospira sp.]